MFVCRPILKSLLAIALSAFCATALAQEKTYSFGVVPQQSAKKLAKLWTPVLKHIGQQTGVKLQFKTAKNIPEFEKRLADGEYDFSYMNPYHFTVFNSNPGYKAVARRKDQPIRGIMVVKKDSTISSVDELNDKKLAFPSPAAFAASVLPRAMLNKKNINFEKKYVSSHDSVYLNVAKGLFTSGGGVMRTFNNTSPKVKEQLKVLWKSPGYTPHAIANHPRVPEDVVKAIQTAMLAMSQDPEANKLLKKLKIKKGLIAATDEDWDDVRGLGIELLQQLINN